MKIKRLLSVFAAFTLTFGLWSCTDDEPEPVVISVAPAEGLVFEAEGGTQQLSVESPCPQWTVEKSGDWIGIAADAEAGRIEVTVGPCDDIKGRSGTITVMGGIEPVTVKIEQKGVIPTLTATPTQLDFTTSDAASDIVEVTASHVEWQIEQPAEKWITAEADRQAGTIRVSVEENTETAPRSGSFRITGEGVEPVTVTIEQKGAIPTLTATPTQLDFTTSDAASGIVEVTASHVEWQIEQPAQQWITAEADRQAGTIRVSVEENTETAPRSGSFRITGEGVEPIVVTVSQAIPFWERSIAYRMGYLGEVKSVARHIDLVNNDGEIELYNLAFDRHGNLTQFTREEDAMTVTVAYDAQNRITEIAAKAADYDFSFLFEYGSHGKYIPTFEIFEYDLDEMFPVDFRVWVPLLIKDLAVLKVRDRLMPDNNSDYRFTIAGDKATLDCYYEAEGYEPYLEYYTIDFAGDYPSLINSEGYEYATYDIDAASGKIRNQTMSSYYEIAFERSLDRLNTITRAMFGLFDMTLTYNEQLDVASRTMTEGADGMASLTATYVYDDAGNWTKTTLSPVGGEPVTVSRTITYWE